MKLVLSMALIACGASAAWADKLPKSAVPMATDEIVKLFAGHTQSSKISEIYFDPAGTTRGVFGKPKATRTLAGKWAVTGNEFCMQNSPKGDTKVYTDCNKFWKVGNQIWNIWSTHYDGSKPNEKTDYVPGTPTLKDGDSVSKAYTALGGT